MIKSSSGEKNKKKSNLILRKNGPKDDPQRAPKKRKEKNCELWCTEEEEKVVRIRRSQKSSLQREKCFGEAKLIFSSHFTHATNILSLSLLKYIHLRNAQYTQGGRISPVYVCVFLSFLINRSEVKKSVLLFKEKLGK